MTPAALARAYLLDPADVARWPVGVAEVFARVALRRGLLTCDEETHA